MLESKADTVQYINEVHVLIPSGLKISIFLQVTSTKFSVHLLNKSRKIQYTRQTPSYGR